MPMALGARQQVKIGKTGQLSHHYIPYRSRQTLIIHLSYAGRPRLSTATSTEDTFTCIAAPADYVISMLPDRDGAVDTLAR